MRADKSIHAVMTGDIVNSTLIGPDVQELLLRELRQVLSAYLIEFYRGDSFQVYLNDPAGALRVALLCRSLAISLTATEDQPALSDIRISIGLGPVVLPVRTPGMARGEAFLLSGRGLDEIQKTESRLSISSGQAIADIGFAAMADHLDAICRHMTTKQAAAIALLLGGLTQQDAALKLNKSKSTVSQLAAAGSWSEIERILQQYEMLINQLV
jgi:hypothetical protein